MNTRNQLIITHSAMLMMLGVMLGAFVMPGWIPPPSPSLTPAEVATIFTPDNVMMRAGILIMCLISPLLIAYSSVITTQLRRIEGKNHVMANAQLASQAAGLCLFLLPGFIWLAISYRPHTNPELIVVLNDLSWFMWFAGIGPTVVQWLCIGIPILGDKSADPVYPRWLGFLNLWLAVGAGATQLIPFVYGGPFGYNGLFGFVFPATVFSIWTFATYFCTLKAIRKQANEEKNPLMMGQRPSIA